MGLILVDDVVDVYVLDRKLQPTEETHAAPGDAAGNGSEDVHKLPGGNADMEYLATAEIARGCQYDNILAY